MPSQGNGLSVAAIVVPPGDTSLGNSIEKCRHACSAAMSWLIALATGHRDLTSTVKQVEDEQA
ncbi:MAG: hypothetical protein OXC53_00585 [Rhodobacteraceae bacterium]|nr:hypothetical protein [Paracoccaceae bacterium]